MALFAIAAFGLLNFVGAKPGAWAIRLFTFGKFAVLLLLVAVLFPELDPGRPELTDHTELTLRELSSAVFMALFALQGFEVVGVPAGEAETPEKKVPFAVFATLLIASGLYIVVPGVLVFSFPGLSKPSDAPLADAALALSPSLGVVVAVGALISTLGFVSGSALGTPRYLFAMASHRQLPAILSRLHPEFRTPSVAILVTSVLAALLVLPFDYRTLIGMSNVAVAVQYGATCVAVLRQRMKAQEAAHRKRHIILAALGVLVSVSIWFAATWQELAFAAVALIVGWGLMWMFASRTGRQ
jgi:amino acid transporter